MISPLCKSQVEVICQLKRGSFLSLPDTQTFPVFVCRNWITVTLIIRPRNQLTTCSLNKIKRRAWCAHRIQKNWIPPFLCSGYLWPLELILRFHSLFLRQSPDLPRAGDRGQRVTLTSGIKTYMKVFSWKSGEEPGSFKSAVSFLPV